MERVVDKVPLVPAVRLHGGTYAELGSKSASPKVARILNRQMARFSAAAVLAGKYLLLVDDFVGFHGGRHLVHNVSALDRGRTAGDLIVSSLARYISWPDRQALGTYQRRRRRHRRRHRHRHRHHSKITVPNVHRSSSSSAFYFPAGELTNKLR